MALNDTSADYRRIYEAPPAATRMAGVRFGNTRDITVMWEGEAEQVSEYIRGLIFIGALAFFLFLMWGMLLTIFMCLGNKHVGYLSGHPNEREAAPVDKTRDQSDRHEDEYPPEEETAKRKAMYRRGDAWGSEATRNRIIFLISGLVVIVFSILLVTKGLTQLQTTVDTVHESSVAMEGITSETRTVILDGLRGVRSRAESVRLTLLQELSLEVFCPADVSMENSQVGRDVREQVDAAVDLLDELEDFQEERLRDLETALLKVEDAALEVEEQTDQTDLLGWKTTILIIPYTIIAAVLMAATVMAFFDVSFAGLNTVINCFLLPTFIVMTCGACAVAGISAIAAGMNSDFCLPGGDSSASPDENIIAIMRAEGYTDNDYELRMVRFYVEQCTSEDDPFDTLRAYLPDMLDNQEALNEVATTLRDGSQLAELALYCNREFAGLDAQIDNMQVILQVLIDSMERLLDLVSCERIVPIYTTTIYDASCEYSTKAVFWVFSCSIILGAFGFIMITLRASYKVTVVKKKEPVVSRKHASKKRIYDEPDLSSAGSSTRDVRATPYKTPPPPPEAPQAYDNESEDEVYSLPPGLPEESDNFGNVDYFDDENTVTREKKKAAVDLD